MSDLVIERFLLAIIRITGGGTPALVTVLDQSVHVGQCTRLRSLAALASTGGCRIKISPP